MVANLPHMASPDEADVEAAAVAGPLPLALPFSPPFPPTSSQANMVYKYEPKVRACPFGKLQDALHLARVIPPSRTPSTRALTCARPRELTRCGLYRTCNSSTSAAPASRCRCKLGALPPPLPARLSPCTRFLTPLSPPSFSYGGWLTVGGTVKGDPVRFSGL